jgi:hypothetical protein
MALLALLIGSASWVGFALRYNVLDYDYSDTFGPAAWLHGDLEVVKGSIQAEVYPLIKSWLPSIISHASSITGINIADIHAIISISSSMAGLLGTAFAARFIARSWISAAITPLVLPFSWPLDLVIGYPANFYMPSVQLGYWAMAWSVLVWALWLQARSGTWMHMLSFALAGVIFDFHSTYGLILLVAFVSADLLEAARSRETLKRLLALSTTAFLLTSLPQLWSLATTPVAPLANADDWWKLMQFRKPFHIFLWNGGWAVANIVSGTLISILMFINIARNVSTTTLVRLIATLFTGLLFCSISYAAVAVWPTPRLAGLVLSRAWFLPIVALVAVGCTLPFLPCPAYRHSDNTEQLIIHRLLGAIVSLLISFSGPALVLRWVLVALLMARPLSGRLSWPSLLRVQIGRRVWWAGLLTIGAGILVAAAIITTDKATKIAAFAPQTERESWTGMTSWIRENTPRDALFLMPPYPYATASTQRSSIIDYAYSGFSVYLTSLVPFELNALESVYGVDLRRLTRGEIPAYIAREGGILCLFETRYTALLSDIERLRELRGMYPNLRFVVGFRPGVTPHEWTCGAYRGPLLPLRIAFQNEEYLVYALD